MARARCSALFTDATLVSRVSAVSCAEKPRTSRRISTARWFAGKQLQGGDEGELHRLTLFVAGVGRGIAVLDAKRLVREGLDPHRLHQGLADAAVRVGRGPIVDRQDPLGTPVDRIE